MFKKRLIAVIQSSIFKKISFTVGLILLFSSLFIAVNPVGFLKFGYLGILFFNALGGGSLFIFTLANQLNPVFLAFFSALGMAINDSLAWVVGNSGQEVIHHNKKIDKIEKTIQKYGVVAIFCWSFIPFPYDLIGFIAGYLGLSYKKYIIATFLGKFIRFLLITLIVRYKT